MARRTKEEIARSKEYKAQKLYRKLETDWVKWGSADYALYTACTKCDRVNNCRGKYRENVVCKTCHFSEMDKYADTELLQSMQLAV